MNIVILGAGEVGKQLAFSLYNRNNNIAIIDRNQSLLWRIKEKLDIMTVLGNAASINVLLDSGIKSTDLLIATTGSDTANILACQIAKHTNPNIKTICRLSAKDFFSSEYNFTQETLGIDYAIYPIYESIDKIMYSISHYLIAENIVFNIPDIRITSIKVPALSSIVGTRISDFPYKQLLDRIRFSAIIRDQNLIVPQGNTMFLSGDEIYVAGFKNDIEQFISYIATKKNQIKKVVISGSTPIGLELAKKILSKNYQLTVIEKVERKGEELLDKLKGNITVIIGDSTDADLLEEAGVDSADAFITLSKDDEENILSCILAKKMGAKKVITVTNKAEYVDIIPGIKSIDSCFSPRISAVNAVLKILGMDIGRIYAILQRSPGNYVYELDVKSYSKICNKRISDLEGKLNSILSLVFRGEEIIPATGELKLQDGDRVITISNPKKIEKIESLFKRRNVI